MVRRSTGALSLKLADGSEVQGVVEREEMIRWILNLLGKRVVVVGRAVYRRSGRILRIDIQHIEEDSGESRLFSRVPAPFTRKPLVKKSPKANTGIAGFFGIWPGEETDEELLAAVEELRG